MRSLALFLTCIVLSTSLVWADKQALEICSVIHNIDLHAQPNADGLFEGKGCALRCLFDGTWLPSQHINHGYHCVNGQQNEVCFDGQCMDIQIYPKQECAKMYNVQLADVNNTGSNYTHDICTLNCNIKNGSIILSGSRNEDKLCEGGNGLCKAGLCDYASKPKVQPRPETPVVVAQSGPANGPFTHTMANLRSIQITFVGAALAEGKNGNPYGFVCLVPKNGRQLIDCLHEPCRTNSADNNLNPSWSFTCPRYSVPEGTDLLIGVADKRGYLIDSSTFKINYLVANLGEEILYSTYTQITSNEGFTINEHDSPMVTIKTKMEFDFHP